MALLKIPGLLDFFLGDIIHLQEPSLLLVIREFVHINGGLISFLTFTGLESGGRPLANYIYYLQTTRYNTIFSKRRIIASVIGILLSAYVNYVTGDQLNSRRQLTLDS